MDRPDDIVDLAGLSPAAPPTTAEGGGPRPWVGIRFDCCGVYARIYRNREATAYCGRCPRCLREVRIRVGREGTDTRFFRAE